DGVRMRPRQRLEKVVMGIDEPGQHHMPAGIEGGVDWRGRRTARGDDLGDPAVLDDKTAARILGEDGERVPDPQPHQRSTASLRPKPMKMAPARRMSAPRARAKRRATGRLAPVRASVKYHAADTPQMVARAASA